MDDLNEDMQRMRYLERRAEQMRQVEIDLHERLRQVENRVTRLESALLRRLLDDLRRERL